MKKSPLQKEIEGNNNLCVRRRHIARTVSSEGEANCSSLERLVVGRGRDDPNKSDGGRKQRPLCEKLGKHIQRN